MHKNHSHFVHVAIPLVLVIFSMIIFALVFTKTINQPPSDQTRSKASELTNDTFQNSEMQKVTGRLIEGFPDLPVYPGAVIVYSYTKNEGNRTGYEAEWKTEATVTTITNWYIQALPLVGWTLTGIPESLATITPPGPLTNIEYMLTARKGNTNVNLIIENEDGGTESEIHAEFPLKEQ